MTSFTPSYPLHEFMRDLERLAADLSIQSRGDEETILAYAHATYDSPLKADSRAHALTHAFVFIAEHGGALIDAGYGERMGNALVIDRRALEALWVYLGMLPGLAPYPEVTMVLALLAGRKDGD